MKRIFLLSLSSTGAVLAAAEGPGDSAPATTSGTGQPAAPANGTRPQGGPDATWIIMILAVAFMWFILIRPQRKEEKRRKEMMAGLKRGDQVVTIGGIHGAVESVGETTIEVKVGSSGKEIVLTFNRGAVNAVVNAGGAAKDKP